MKKLFLLTLLSCLFSSFLKAQSFDLSNLRAGAGFYYVTDINSVAFTSNAAYTITPKWEGVVAFTHTFEKDNLSYNIIDADAHFNFYPFNNDISLCGIGGLGLTFSKLKVKGFDAVGNSIKYTNTDNELGFNFGVGANIPLREYLNLAPEFKFTTAYGSYFRFGATIQYCF